ELARRWEEIPEDALDAGAVRALCGPASGSRVKNASGFPLHPYPAR
ncbi:MAG: hypothetical protein QOF44_3957, partial [Streptomyces sp.]|nr:hypothetical protein [Streptomyces sp.]